MFSFSLATSSPAEPVPPVHCKQNVMRKGLGRDVQPKGAFPAAIIWVTNKPESTDWPNLKRCGCGVCSRRVAIHLPLETATSSSEAGKASVRFSFRSTSLRPPQFQSPPRSPFTFGNKSALRTGTKHGQEKKRTPILRETNQQWAQQVVCGLLGSTQVAFLPWLCAAIEGLQHLRPWHCHLIWDLELLQKAQKTCTSGQKLEAGSTWGCSGGWMI